MSEQQQDTLIEQLTANGVRTVRTGISAKFTNFIIRAYQHGIGAVVIVYPTQGSTDTHMRPADPSVSLMYGQLGMTGADPAKFKTLLTAQLAPLEAAGVHLTAIELGNEINGPYFNGDFLPAQALGRVLGISDLNNPDDAGGQAIAASYRAYLKIAAVLKDVRDYSQVNKTTPIISAGLADGGLPGKKPGQRLDGVSIPATLEFFRQNGIDNLVDGYGVHVYPSGNPAITLAARIDDLNKDAFASCTTTKPCWLTEWGFNNPDQSCPINDEKRAGLIKTERDAFKPFSRQGRLAAVIFYSWSGAPGEKADQGKIFRCGALTDAGKLALGPM